MGLETTSSLSYGFSEHTLFLSFIYAVLCDYFGGYPPSKYEVPLEKVRYGISHAC